MSPVRTRERIAGAAQLACLLEVTAPKPGNVSLLRAFGDVEYRHFLASATAIGPPLAQAFDHGIGATVLAAITATRSWTTTNTNLGMVLLLTPLVKAAGMHADDAPADMLALRHSLRRVLTETTVQDARDVFAAIRLAAPGGLGSVAEQDVHAEPTIDLVAAMRLAEHRDTIAREYTSAFDVTFTLAWPSLARARRDGLTWNDATVETFLTVLAARPDTHIARRAGEDEARRVSDAAQRVLDAGSVRTAEGRRAVATLHDALEDPTHRRNPGTSADITCAAIFLALFEDGYTFTDTVPT